MYWQYTYIIFISIMTCNETMTFCYISYKRTYILALVIVIMSSINIYFGDTNLIKIRNVCSDDIGYYKCIYL